MVRAKGKVNASTKKSASKNDTVSLEAAVSTNDSSEMENIVETGDQVEISVETALAEQTTITVVAEEENDGAQDGGLEGEHAMEEDEDKKQNDVVEEDESYGADEKEEEDTTGNNQENATKEKGGDQIIDDNGVGAATGNQEDALGKYEDETNAKGNNKEKVEGSLKQKTKRLRGKNKKRKATETSQEKGEKKQVKKKVASNGVIGKELRKSGVRVDDDKSSKKVSSQGKSRMAPQDKDIEDKDKLESSRKNSSLKKKKKKKASTMGMIFMCNSETKKDCYRYKVLGLPAGKKEMVEKVYKGMRLFLYDVDLKLMYGIYKAAGHGGQNIEPKAFKSQFPSQVRFSVLEDCLPLPEETFRQVIKKNYYTRSKFDCLLSSEQVKDLCKLFATAGKGSRSHGTQLEFETHVISKRDRAKRRGRGERRRAERARRPERVEERGYRELVEERAYHERDEERGYREHPHLYDRSLVTSPLLPLAPLHPLPPPAPVQSYAYRRTLVPETYRGDRVQHNDSYRQSRLEELPDAYYRRDTVIGNPDVYRRQAVVEPRDYYRREGLPERREYHQPLNLETRIQGDVRTSDPYVSYRKRLLYQDPVNSVHSQPEYDPPTGLRADYHHGGLSTEYSSTRSMRPEYPSSAATSLYEYHPREPQYRY